MHDGFEVLGLIPARGGSKSIPYKNIKDLAGLPLLVHVAEAGWRCPAITRILCSTDDDKIAAVCGQLGIEVDRRPDALAGDDSPIVETMIELVERMEKQQGYVPDAIALLQPTSPFTLPEHIEMCVKELQEHPEAGSTQTVASIPHSYHAYNQRHIVGGVVDFRFPEERAICYNKQAKPEFYVFGNVVVVRTAALRDQRLVFAAPSRPIKVARDYALDVDVLRDFPQAEWYIQQGLVTLPWL